MNVSNPRRTLLQRAALVIAAAVAGGCGFRLRGAANIPFETVALQGAENTAFAVELRRSLLANRNVRIVDDPKLAQAILQIAGMSQERRILSLSGAGRVREFQLIFRVSYRVHDGKGRDLIAGLPKTITITSQEIREAMSDPLSTIVDAVRTTLERCPPELAADLVDRGIVLAGGGALLRGLDRLLREETGLPVHVAEDPLSAVAEGTGKMLQEIEVLKRVTTSSHY